MSIVRSILSILDIYRDMRNSWEAPPRSKHPNSFASMIRCNALRAIWTLEPRYDRNLWCPCDPWYLGRPPKAPSKSIMAHEGWFQFISMISMGPIFITVMDADQKLEVPWPPKSIQFRHEAIPTSLYCKDLRLQKLLCSTKVWNSSTVRGLPDFADTYDMHMSERWREHTPT